MVTLDLFAHVQRLAKFLRKILRQIWKGSPIVDSKLGPGARVEPQVGPMRTFPAHANTSALR